MTKTEKIELALRRSAEKLRRLNKTIEGEFLIDVADVLASNDSGDSGPAPASSKELAEALRKIVEDL